MSDNMSDHHVLYAPGQEPDALRARLNRFFEKLDSAYPDKQVRRLSTEHKKWAETLTSLYRTLGYPNGNALLEAYGYTVVDVRHEQAQSADIHAEIIDELRKRYADGPTCASVTELATENPDLAPRFKSLMNLAPKHFGMALSQYFIQEGILTGKMKADGEKELKRLKTQFAENPFVGTAKELEQSTPEIDWVAVKRYHKKVSTATLKVFLIEQGVLSDRTTVIEQTAQNVLAELRIRYTNGPFDGTLDELHAQNNDLPMAALVEWLRSKGLSEKDFLVQEHIVVEKVSASKRLENLIATLQERQTLNNEEVYTVTELARRNPDLPLGKLKEWCKTVLGKSAVDYLVELDILSETPEMKQRRLEQQQRAEAARMRMERVRCEMEDPIVPTYYTPPVYYVEEVDVSGEDVAFWKTTTNYRGGTSGELFLVDYLGEEEAITLPSTISGQKVIGIVDGGFKSCTASSLSIPGSYKSIPDYFASDNEHIRSVTIGEGITSVGGFAFNKTSNLEYLMVSASIGSVGPWAFDDTKWFENQDGYVIVGTTLLRYKGDSVLLNVPHGVTTISKYVNRSAELGRVYLPETVTTLDEEAFNWHSRGGIEEFIYTESLVNIGHNALGNHPWLESFGDKPIVINGQIISHKTASGEVVIPEGVTKIGCNVYANNKQITKVVCPSSLQMIEAYAFTYSTLESIVLPDTLEHIKHGVFQSCQRLKTVQGGLGIKEIDTWAFLDCHSLETIPFGEQIRTIGASAFENCENLQSIAPCPLLEEIGKEAFENCKRLKSATLPAIVGEGAFSKCTSLEHVIFSPAMASIPKACFNGCQSIKEIIIPDGVECIEANAFMGCTSLQTISIPSSVQIIGGSAFARCENLKSVTLPNNLKSLEDGAFWKCTSLQNVTLPISDFEVGSNVFGETPYMQHTFGDFAIIKGVLLQYNGTDTHVVIPAEVTKIARNSFEKAMHVESIYIPDNVQVLESYLMGVKYGGNDEGVPALQTLVIGNGVKTIGDSAFSGCSNLTDVTFGKNVTHIGKSAFNGCSSLTTVDMSDTMVETIGEYAFLDCYGLKTIRFSPVLRTIERGAFVSACLETVALPKSVEIVGIGAFDATKELVVYDTIDPFAAPAQGILDDSDKPSLSHALSSGYQKRSSVAGLNGYHITVLNARTEDVKYCIFYDSTEAFEYPSMMISAWGLHANFDFETYDRYFKSTRSREGRVEMAFCRMEHPFDLSQEHKRIYEAFLERCLYIEQSARRTARLIGSRDAVDRLRLLDSYKAIDDHNREWIREELQAVNAKRCLAFIDDDRL